MRFFILFLIVITSCTNDTKLVQEFVSDKDMPIEQIKGAQMIHTENGKIKVRVIANIIERFQDVQPALIFSDNLEVYFYNDSSQLQSTLMADYASIDEEKKIMFAKNNVILISIDDKRLETDELVWDEKKNKIYTDRKVKISTKKEVIFGEGFISTPDFKEYSITKVHGTFDFSTQTN